MNSIEGCAHRTSECEHAEDHHPIAAGMHKDARWGAKCVNCGHPSRSHARSAFNFVGNSGELNGICVANDKIRESKNNYKSCDCVELKIDEFASIVEMARMK